MISTLTWVLWKARLILSIIHHESVTMFSLFVTKQYEINANVNSTHHRINTPHNDFPVNEQRCYISDPTLHVNIFSVHLRPLLSARQTSGITPILSIWIILQSKLSTWSYLNLGKVHCKLCLYWVWICGHLSVCILLYSLQYFL